MTPRPGENETELPPLVGSRGSGPWHLAIRVRRVRRLLVESPVDVVIAHGGWAAQVAALAVHRSCARLVWQRITLSPSMLARWRHWWWRAVARRFDAAVALTQELADELVRLGFRGPIWLIPNSRQPDRFLQVDRATAAVRLRTEVGVADDAPVYAIVGQLDPVKRVDRALAVHARMIELGLRPHLVVVGSGPLRAELEAEATRLGITATVHFLGRRTDVEWILAGADVLVLTSDLEGMPGVAIEAAMAGCPVVSIPVGGIHEVVEDGVTGLVLPDADPGRMAEAVAALLADVDRREAMGTAARVGSERFSAATTVRAYADALVALVRGS